MTLSRPVSHAAAVALLGAVSWLAWAGIAVPVLDQLAEDRDSIGRSQQLLARYTQLAAAVPALQRQLDALKGSASEKAFLPGASTASMTAEMQAAAQRLAGSAGAVLHSSRTLPRELEDGFGKVGVELDLAASAASLASLLHAVEAAEPAILVERLAVRVPETGAAPKAPDGQPALGVNLRLVSYARPPAPATPMPVAPVAGTQAP